MGMPEPSCQTAFADDETSEYFSVTEGSSRQGTPRFKGKMGSGMEHSKMKEFSMTGYAEGIASKRGWFGVAWWFVVTLSFGSRLT